jgi:hypothetical protein
MSRFRSPNVGAVLTANGTALMLNPPPGIPHHKGAAFTVHFIREIKDGIELRTRFWLGYHVLEKIPYFLLPKGVRIPEMGCASLARHNVLEFANLASFLPELYEEQKGAIP